MSSTTYRVDSTVGQIIGVSESTNYRLEAGYWYGVEVQPQGLCGDVNCMGGINMGDVGALHNHVQYGYPLSCCPS